MQEVSPSAATVSSFRYFTGIAIPTLLLLGGVIGKKLSRQIKGWKRTDFYLGAELTLAAVSAALINVFDLLRPDRTAAQDNHRILLSNLIVAGLGGILFLFVLSL